MKILICDKTETEAIHSLRQAGLQVDVCDDISAEELLQVLPAYDGMVVRSRTKVRAPLIDACPNLKVIVRGGVGLDTIDADYARSKGITVMNTPKASSASVAELAIGYMFALARQTPQTTASMKAGKWEKKKFEGDEIVGKTLGVIGYGNIGYEVAWRAIALGMTVLVYDLRQLKLERIETVTLDALLSRSDYITLHLPLTDETRNLIGTAEFARMKTGCAPDQLRTRRYRGRGRPVRCHRERQGRRGSPGRVRPGTQRRPQAVQPGAGDRQSTHRRGHQRGPGPYRRGSGRQAD